VFGVGLPEMAVIAVVALLIFGPDRLPEFARQAGRMLRQLRQFSQAARDDIRAELGPEYADFELRDLDPRRAVRKYIDEAWDDADDRGVGANGGAPAERPGLRPLERGERPPFDADAT
jgi:sec-independent protein translocase protein TatB